MAPVPKFFYSAGGQCKNWVWNIFENQFFRGSWFNVIVGQEFFGTQPFAIQTKIWNSDHSVWAHRRLRKLRHLFEELNRGWQRKPPFELRTAVYQKIPAPLRHCTSSLWKTDFQIFPLFSCENNIVVETCEISVFFYKPCFVKLKEEKLIYRRKNSEKKKKKYKPHQNVDSNLVILLALIIQE